MFAPVDVGPPGELRQFDLDPKASEGANSRLRGESGRTLDTGTLDGGCHQGSAGRDPVYDNDCMRPVFDFHGMVGQKRVCSYLSRLTDGARARGRVAPSLLLVGPAGHGKSSLAAAYARRIGTQCREFKKGRSLKNPALVAELQQVEHGDVVRPTGAGKRTHDRRRSPMQPRMSFGAPHERFPCPGGLGPGQFRGEMVLPTDLSSRTYLYQVWWR